MRDEFGPASRRLIKGILVASVLGLSLGYAVFYSIVPNVSVPTTGEASFPFIVVLLLLTGFLAGLATESLPMAIAEGFASIPVGAAVASALCLSPLLTGRVSAQADELVGFFLRLGLPIYLLGIPLYVVSGLAGMLGRERLGLRPAPWLRPRLARERK